MATCPMCNADVDDVDTHHNDVHAEGDENSSDQDGEEKTQDEN